MASFLAIVLVSAVMVGGPVSPAHATSHVPADGTYLCTTGVQSIATPNFTITAGVVSSGSSCAGAVVIPAGVTSIGDWAFAFQSALTSITIPASVTSIGNFAFYDAIALTSITIPASVTSIGNSAFSGPISLTSVTFAEGSTLTSIGDHAFYGATALTSITIPASVTSIGEMAFSSGALTSITFDGTSTLTSIGNSAFNSARSLTSVTIPASVTSIGDWAFANATLLTSVYFLGDAPTGGDRPFNGVAAGAKAYIKSGATGFEDICDVWNNLTVAVVYSVTYDSSGGSVVASGSFLPNGAISQAPTEPTKSGYTFTGWSATDGGSTLTFPYTPTSNSDLTLYAQWTAVAAPPPSSGGGTSSGSVAVQSGSAAVQSDPAPTRAVVVVPRRAQVVPPAASPAVIQRTQQSSGSSQPAEAVALVGGEEVAVKATTQSSQAARYGVGKVTVDVGVAAKDGVVDSVGGVPSLKIARNSPASVKGAGLQPNSTMQVFLQASDGSFIELPSVVVAADGSFDGSLTLGTSGRSMPMPIGKRFIQMVGVDDEGNETVLDIPVTIAQPLPAPEINRVSGERPALTPGQALAFNAGAPETVTLKRSSAATSVEGEDWAFTVAGSTTDESGQTLAFTRDAPVTFSGEGFMPGTRADVWLFSDPTLVGTVDIAEDGTFTASFAVDSNVVPTGDHTLQIQGVGDDGFVRAANLGVVVEDPVSTPLAPIDSDPIGWVLLMFIGTSVGGLLVLVGVTLAVRRGQRPQWYLLSKRWSKRVVSK